MIPKLHSYAHPIAPKSARRDGRPTGKKCGTGLPARCRCTERNAPTTARHSAHRPCCADRTPAVRSSRPSANIRRSRRSARCRDYRGSRRARICAAHPYRGSECSPKPLCRRACRDRCGRACRDTTLPFSRARTRCVFERAGCARSLRGILETAAQIPRGPPSCPPSGLTCARRVPAMCGRRGL